MIAYELHREAEEELYAGAAFYEGRVAGLGFDFLDEVVRAIDLICERPLAHHSWPELSHEPDIRRKLVNRFPYALPFMLHHEHVIVLAVAHLSREPAFWLSRAREFLR